MILSTRTLFPFSPVEEISFHGMHTKHLQNVSVGTKRLEDGGGGGNNTTKQHKKCAKHFGPFDEHITCKEEMREKNSNSYQYFSGLEFPTHPRKHLNI